MTADTDSIKHLEQTRHWLVDAAPGDWLDWRFFVHTSSDGTPARPVALVIWEAGVDPCLRCRQPYQRGCPVTLDDENGIRDALPRHSCGYESAPARHVTIELTEIGEQADIQRLVQQLDHWRPHDTTADLLALRSSGI